MIGRCFAHEGLAGDNEVNLSLLIYNAFRQSFLWFGNSIYFSYLNHIQEHFVAFVLSILTIEYIKVHLILHLRSYCTRTSSYFCEACKSYIDVSITIQQKAYVSKNGIAGIAPKSLNIKFHHLQYFQNQRICSNFFRILLYSNILCLFIFNLYNLFDLKVNV